MPDMRWLRRGGGSTAPELRLFCLPYAGGGASMFRGWRLPAGVEAEVWGVQPPGRENRWREPLLRSSEAMTAEITAALQGMLDLPYAIFGHSMGALLAYEVVRALRAEGAPPPVRLLVSAHRAPHLPAWRSAISPLPEREFLERLAEMARPSSAVILDPEVVDAFAPMMRADFELCENYRYRPGEPLDVPVSCFGAVDDPEVRMDELEAWRQHTTGEFRLHPFRGGHLFLRDHRDDLLADVWSDLRRPAGREVAP